MAEPSLQLGNGNWAGKSGNLLAYHKANNNFYADDLTFARASTGTIVNSDGLIEEVPYNLVTYSEDFSEYTEDRVIVSTDEIISPNGNKNADKIAETTDSGVHRAYGNTINIVSGNDYTISVFAKKGTANVVQLTLTTTSIIGTGRANFDLDSGTTGTVSGGTSSIVDDGNGWYRCIFSFEALASGTSPISLNLVNNVTTAARNLSYTGDGNSYIYLWGAQLNAGSTAKTYYPTTTRLNIPRVDYLNNSNGSLLLEPQRTNLVTQSEDFSNAAWTKSNATVTSNNVISPDGTLSASSIAFTAGGGYLLESITTTKTIGSSETISVFSKTDISGTFLKYGGGTASGTDVENKESFGNGWYRYSVTRTFTEAETASTQIIISSSEVGLNTVIYGAMLEAGSYATSIIPTSGTTVTRLLDTFYNDNLEGAIGQTEGTFYLETVPLNSLTSYTERVVQFESSGSDFMTIQRSANSTITFYGTNGVNSWSIIQTGLFVGGETIKIAGAYKDNDIALYVNGVQIGTNTSASAPQTQKLRFANNPSGSLGYLGSHKEFQLYKTRLTNTELATLTTI